MKRNKKKSLLEEIKATIHFLTKPKKTSKRISRRRKPATAKRLNQETESLIGSQKDLEQKMTKKMSDEIQKMKREVQIELLEKLKKHQATRNTERHVSEATSNKKKATVRKKPGDETKKPASLSQEKFKPQTDCTFIKLLVLSDSVKGEVVVGYEIQDNGSKEVWGIGIHEGTSLGRSKLIRNTKVKSRTQDSKRQYYLANDTDDTLYFSESYKKPAIAKGKITVPNYTDALADAIQQAYLAGYTNNSKLPKL